MDRIEAMRVFVTALDEGSLAAAGRRLSRSPAAVSRAIAFLEDHVGAPLLHRTTRTIRLSEAGERYAEACRRILTELEEADLLAAGEAAAPRGLLTVSGPLVSGALVLRPILDAYLAAYPAVRARLLLFDRQVNLVDEGIDVALRIAYLPDSSLIALRVGDVRRVVVASPAYLKGKPPITAPADVAEHDCIAMTGFGHDTWTFSPAVAKDPPQQVKIAPRLVVNTVSAALGSAIDGYGLTRVFSYQAADEVRAGRLVVVLRDETYAQPVHLLAPRGRLSVPKVRAFVDFAGPRLKADFARMAML
ncbi:MAG: LysR family transcriptional regulator [Rhodospirillaceae bacterium]|nr:MAG: LysR family transcriptional regulator [Rhodospirillaceae bacterium]